MTHRLTLFVASALLATAFMPAAGAGLQPATPDPVAGLAEADANAASSPLDRGIGLVHAATDVQADRAGLGAVDAAELSHGLSASEAAELVLSSTGQHTSEASLGDLHELAPAVDAALADVMVAFLALEEASQASFGAADADAASLEPGTGEISSPMDAWQAHDLDPRPALAARATLLDAIGQLGLALDATSSHDEAEVHQPPALVVDLGQEDDTYTEDVRLLIDAGGDDTYENNAGGTGADLRVPPGPDDAGSPAAALVDLDGADTYGEPALEPRDRRQGINGGGLFGVGMLVDDGGDDVYAGYADGVNGGALVGVGLVLDTAGSDTYTAEGWGANGGGYPAGFAQLVDLAGDDTYTGSYEAVNGGGALGTGLLYDGGGEDRYEATRTGTNGGGFLGQGLLVDRGDGDDGYVATADGVNGGAFGGSGLLFDEGGDDTYLDEDGGSGEDRTVVPKGPAGVQLDR